MSTAYRSDRCNRPASYVEVETGGSGHGSKRTHRAVPVEPVMPVGAIEQRMSGELTLRQYEPTDAEGVLSVRKKSLLASGWEFDEDVHPEGGVTDELLGISTGVLEAGGEFLVGIDEGRIVAIGGFKPKDGTTAELVWMGVRPEDQRRGHAEAVLEELEKRAIESGFARIELETFERLTAARRLYRKHGYERVQRENDPRTGDDRMRYEKEL